MAVSPSALRKDLYNLLDRVIETGEPLEIDRNGVIVRLVPPRLGWLHRLQRRPSIVRGDPEDLVEIDWSSEWSPEPR